VLRRSSDFSPASLIDRGASFLLSRRLQLNRETLHHQSDRRENTVQVYLSLIALAGLAINAIWRVKWADPIAALVVLPLIVWEGREAMRGKACGCC
jgi:divalent metal cation (Fe/Co/Zn/Cd) transporter